LEYAPVVGCCIQEEWKSVSGASLFKEYHIGLKKYNGGYILILPNLFTVPWMLSARHRFQETAGKDRLFLGSGIRCRNKISKKTLLIS
jgi:hypothetical protein